MMERCLLFAALVFALVFGTTAGYVCGSRYRDDARRKKAKDALGAGSASGMASVSLESTGLSAQIIERAILFSLLEKERFPFSRIASLDYEMRVDLIEKAGLANALNKNGYARCRVFVAFFGAAGGALIGSVFSSVLMGIGAIAGLAWGWNALVRAVREESRCRALSAERQLSQMIEVLVLGLKSGMSFDRSLALYCESFRGSLSATVRLAQSQWSHSLIDRNEGLRQIARSYDSPLFERFSESVIRSLRFGTSLADNLGLLAVETRAIRKAKLEEQVAKAPVKMLLPVGTLILPAMLIFVMGPIMLDLMNGF